MKWTKKIAYSRKVAPYIFILPFVLSFLIFNLYPILSSLVMSFQKLKGFSAIFFVPTLASTVVAGIVFRMLFSDSENAVANSILITLGMKSQNFMLNYKWSIVLMVVLSAWKSVGLYMIYFLSGLSTIPVELYEAAQMDGAGEWKKFRYITVPLLRPIMIYVFTIVIFEGYRTFGESYVFWKESMPGNLGLTMVRYLYQQAFTYGELGFGSAIGFVLLGIVLLINLAQLKGFGLFQDE